MNTESNQKATENLVANNAAAPAQVFIASAYWRGAMNVGDLRTFDNEPDAVNYAQGMFGGCRVYEVFTNKSPRLVLAL